MKLTFTLSQLKAIAILIIVFNLGHRASSAAAPGDSLTEFDTTKADPHFPAMAYWARAGVQGGIPTTETKIDQYENIRLTPDSGDNSQSINQAIDHMHSKGGGIVILQPGTYKFSSPINMKSDVILQGTDKKAVKLVSSIRFNSTPSGKKSTNICFHDTNNAALENITLEFHVSLNGKTLYPLDHDWDDDFTDEYERRSQNWKNGRIYFDRRRYKFFEANDLYVDHVLIDGTSTNCWLDNCAFINAGSNGLKIMPNTSHITIRNCEIKGSFNKGEEGNGYGIDCRGDYVLMVGNYMERVRHWAVQLGAEYCVIYNCVSKVDINFHQKDNGNNLVENSVIEISKAHLWKCFQAGADFHADPGENNFFYNNKCTESTGLSTLLKSNVYTFTNKMITEVQYKPKGRCLYAIRPKQFEITEWENSDGVIIKAKLIRRNGPIVHLQLQNGHITQYPIDKLSQASQKALVELLK